MLRKLHKTQKNASSLLIQINATRSQSQFIVKVKYSFHFAIIQLQNISFCLLCDKFKIFQQSVQKIFAIDL